MNLYRSYASNAITPLLLLQIGIIVIGCLAIKITMKIMGYDTPDGEFYNWSVNCVFIRN